MGIIRNVKIDQIKLGENAQVKYKLLKAEIVELNAEE